MIKHFFSILLFFIIDRFTKIYVLKNPSPEFGGGFFDLHINENIAFSLPLTYFILYPIIILIIIAMIWIWKKDFDKKSVLIWPWALIIIGALSNFLDRLRYGGVIDFINVPYFSVFNLSDVYISIGVIWVVWYLWFYKKNKKA